MKFSTIATLCVAPLAMAGSLEVGLERRNEIIVESTESTTGNSNGKFSKTSNSKGNSNAAAAGSSTEVIIIWVNNGGGAPTSTVNAPAATAAAAAAAATHSVS